MDFQSPTKGAERRDFASQRKMLNPVFLLCGSDFLNQSPPTTPGCWAQS